MYSIKWAEKVYSSYIECNARAQNMPAVIVQTAEHLGLRNLTRDAVIRHVVMSIAGSGAKTLWSDYKRLCKRTPLDGKLLEKVCRAIYWPEMEDFLQMRFDFGPEWPLDDDEGNPFAF